MPLFFRPEKSNQTNKRKKSYRSSLIINHFGAGV